MTRLSLKPAERERARAAGRLRSEPQPQPRRHPGEPTGFDLALAWLNSQFDSPAERPILPRWPFALGVREALLADPRRKPTSDPQAIVAALAKVCTHPVYRMALARPGARRHGVDGIDAGPVSDEDRHHAQRWLDKRAQKSEAPIDFVPVGA